MRGTASEARVIIRPYDERDATVIFELWQAALSEKWPLTKALFQIIIGSKRGYQTMQHFVAIKGGAVVGFVATQTTANIAVPGTPIGSICALYVAPRAQRRGIGRMLLEKAFEHLRGLMVSRVQLGGWEPRFWPGVPANLPGACAFVEACGWSLSRSDYDLVRHLDDYETPPAIIERLHDEGIWIEPATRASVSDVIAFQLREFPPWHEHYHYTAAIGDYADILVAREGDEVVGALLMCSPDLRPKRSEVIWQTILGPDMGALNAVGVAQHARGRGIGIGLVARGSEILKARKAGCCHIGWTGLLDFYGKLGYTPWREYKIARRELSVRTKRGA